MKKELRYYQKEAKQSVFDNLEKGIKNQMLVLATGTGKTRLASEICLEFKNILWLTHTEELISQSATSLISELTGKDTESIIEKYGDMLDFINHSKKMSIFLNEDEKEIFENCGIIKAEHMDIGKKYTIASVQSIHRRLDKLSKNEFDLIVIDECHYATANTWFKIIEYFTPNLLIGLTATPYRSDGTSLGSIFDVISYEYNIDKAVKDGYLCEIDAIRIKTNVNLDQVRTTAGELNQKDLDNYVNCPERNNLIVDSYEKYAKGRQGIIFAVNVQHALDITAVFRNRGYDKVDYVVGDKLICSDRKEKISKFKSNEIEMLVNVMILTAGFDYPNTGFIGMTCPTKSLVKYLQCIGRGTRLKDKEYINSFGQNVIVLDFVDVTSRHRLINTWELDKEKPHEEKVFVSTEKREKLIQARNTRIERLTNKDEKVNLLKLPKVNISTSPNMKKPASPKQLSYLKMLGYDVVNNFYSIFDASCIISEQPANKATIYKLQKEGYDVSTGVTLGEAKLAFDEIERKSKLKKEAIEQQKIIRNYVNTKNDF
jgi:superfamily II DNA or RNA helicase